MNKMAEDTLHGAANTGDLKQVKRLLASGIEPDAGTGQFTRTPLILASGCGYTDTVIELIKAKADINYKDTNDQTPLMWATKNGYTDTVIELIKGKADINGKDIYDSTPLMLAAACGYTDIAHELVKTKANINYKTKNNRTPLLNAADAGSTDIVIALLKAKANIDAKADAIMMAKKWYNSDVVSVLKQAKKNYKRFLDMYMTEEEKSNPCRREYGRAFALASRVTESPNFENITMEKVQTTLPPGYRDLIEFFSRNPGLVKWTGTALLLYFNAGALDSSGSDRHAIETRRRCTVM